MTRKTMDFFGSQEKARRKTLFLILLFILAVFFLVAGIYVLARVPHLYSLHQAKQIIAPMDLWHTEIFMWVSLIVIGVVFIGSVHRILSLSKGGQTVAEMLGGTPVHPNSNDRDERRLLNVVEEMALASGVPVPQVYLLAKEPGINAFAAGLTPENAVITVTQGCMKDLTRDELQGVVAHEFSHILNGDMCLNIRLMGIVAGILIIGLTGKKILTWSGKMALRLGKVSLIMLYAIIPGLLIMVLGYIGVLFGKIIKSSVSRQREYLADAAAVQFTRNPAGLIGALKKIAARETGSRIQDVHAEEASHLFFENGLKRSFFNPLATHPSIKKRIRRIDAYASIHFREDNNARAAEIAPAPGISFLAPGALSSSGPADGIRLTPDRLTALVGNPQAGHLAFATQVLSSLPPVIAQAAREPAGSRLIVYCLLLHKETDARENQIELLKSRIDPTVLKEMELFVPVVDAIGIESRLPLVELLIPALRLLSLSQYEIFCQTVKSLIEADNKINAFEYSLQRMLIRHLDPVFKNTPPPAIKFHALDQVQKECGTLLSVLAWKGGAGPSEAEAAFRRGISKLGAAGEPALPPGEQCDWSALDGALDKLALTSLAVRKTVLEACLACISADDVITTDEAELLRAIADSLDCPIPPLGGAPDDPVAGREQILPSEKRPACVTVIGWAWILIGGWLAFSAARALFGYLMITYMSHHPEMLQYVPANFRFSELETPIVLCLAILGFFSGINFLRRKAWSRKVLEILTWILFLPIVCFGVYSAYAMIFVYGSGGPQVAGVMKIAIFAVLLGIMLVYLRGEKVRSAMISPVKPVNHSAAEVNPS